MAKVDYVKVNNTIRYIQNVAYLSELPVANENSADFVSVNNELYVKQVNGTTYTYAKVGGSGGGLTVLEKTLDGEFEIGAENLRFTEDFSQEEFDLLYNFQAIIRFDIDLGDGISSLYLVPTESANVEGNASITCLLNYGGMMNVVVSLMLWEGELTYQISTIPIESGGSGSGIAFIDITGLDILPSEYQNEETLKTAILFDTDHLLRLTWIDDMYYFGNTDDFQYRYLSIDTSDWVIMRYDLQEIAKAPKVVNLNTYVPSTATNGTLDSSVLATLQASDSNYIVFNNEIFKLADKQHNEGYLVYSHNGHDTTGCFFQKCITITISTRGWVLEEQENQAKLTAGSGITIENNVISSTGGGSNIQVVENDDNTIDLIIS